MPLLHFPGVMAATALRGGGAADRNSTRFSTPVLITETQTIADSAEILRFASAQLEPGDPRAIDGRPEAWALAESLSAKLGAHSRRWVYFHLLPSDSLMRDIATHAVGRVQAAIFYRARRPISAGLRRALGVDAARSERSRIRLLETFAEVDELLADGRPFLCGDQFSVADLSFAALASIVLLVGSGEGYGAWIPSIEEVDDQAPVLGEFAKRLRETPAGAFVLRMFAEQRGQRTLACEHGLDHA